MPFLKTLSGGSGSCRQVDDYLAFGHTGTEDHEERMERYLAGDKSASRSMAFGHSPGLPDSPFGWHKVMDATRKRFGKDRPPEWFEKKRRDNPDLVWRNYYQWVLSPDPRDRASAEEVGRLAQEWCESMWPASKGWQWVWSVHDDNANGVMHAHIILNAVNASTGLKVQITPKDSDMLARRAQEIGEEHGMNTLPDLAERRKLIAEGRQNRTSQAVRMSSAERSLRRRGKRSWVAEVRDEIDRAVDSSSTWDEFVEKLEGDGFSVEWSRRGIGFRHPESHGHDKKVLATSLGTDYGESGIRARIGIPTDHVLVRGQVESHEAKRAERFKAPVGYSPAGPYLSEALRARIACDSRRRGRRSVVSGIKALSVISSRGLRTYREVEEAFRDRLSMVDGLEHDVHEIEATISVAEEVVRRSDDIRGAKSRLAQLESGTLDPVSRKERNRLLSEIEGDRAFCSQALSQVVSGPIEDEEITGYATDLLQSMRERLGDVSVELDSARADAEALGDAVSVIDGSLGQRSIRDMRSVPSLGEFVRRTRRNAIKVPTRLPSTDDSLLMAAVESAESLKALSRGVSDFDETVRQLQGTYMGNQVGFTGAVAPDKVKAVQQ